MAVLTYNSATTVRECLDALTKQEFKEFDVIVVDDDSTDETLQIIATYERLLNISVIRNGAHNIPRGRNLALAASRSDLVAFVDSDDFAAEDWTKVIVDTCVERPELAAIAGNLNPIARNRTAKAIALNDATIRETVGRGIMQFCAGNCAINRTVLPGNVFNEGFRHGEDLELISRVQQEAEWLAVPSMVTHHASRGSLRAYARQMHAYGRAKARVGYRFNAYRWIDYFPLAMLIGGAAAAGALGSWWYLLALVPFSVLEAGYVIVHQRCSPLLFGISQLPG